MKNPFVFGSILLLAPQPSKRNRRFRPNKRRRFWCPSRPCPRPQSASP